MTADTVPYLALDLAVSLLSGVVIVLSIYQLRNTPFRKSAGSGIGLAGIVAALVAGACPCYYLVPLLVVAGGAGGVLGAVGIFFYSIQIPIKLASLALLAVTTLVLERSLRAACAIPPVTG